VVPVPLLRRNAQKSQRHRGNCCYSVRCRFVLYVSAEILFRNLPEAFVVFLLAPPDGRFMSNRFDEASRILASPMPRRQAMQRITGLVFGAAFAGLWTRQAKAVDCNPACKPGQTCCAGSGRAFCINAGTTCCGNTSCAASETCCTNSSGGKFCSVSAGSCCGNTSCAPAQSCCTNSGGGKFCSVSAGHCCGNTSCAPSQTCCSTNPTKFCVAPAQTCCGTTSCGPTQKCCGNSVCCGQSQSCVSGRCSASNGDDDDHRDR
jgi:hypothetical protein